jgi:hypothetical protein
MAWFKRHASDKVGRAWYAAEDGAGRRFSLPSAGSSWRSWRIERKRTGSRIARSMRKPIHTRNNTKHRRIKRPPSGVDVAQVAASSRYVGSPYHRDSPGFAGVPRARPDASGCPQHLANCHGVVKSWLREGIRAGRFGAWEGGYPRYVWHRQGDVVFEAKQGSPGSGEYHGYPLRPEQRVIGLA